MRDNSTVCLKILLLTVCVSAAFGILPERAFPSEIVAATSSRSADPGSAYDSEHQAFVGQACLQKKYHLAGSEKASGNFQLLNNETTTADQLGFSAGARASYGVVSGSAEARFFREAKSNAFSVSAVWVSEYNLLSYKLDSDAAVTIGTDVRNDPTRWKTTCGDEYVDEIVRGAKLFFSIRIDFASQDIKQQFETNFSVAGPSFSADMSFKQASEKFSRDSKVTVSALQVGGNAAKFTGLFPDTVDGRASFVSCTLGDFSNCQKVIQAALKYATDVESGFPAQLSDKETLNYVLYRTVPYSALGIFPKYPKEMTELIERDRSDIHSRFEKELLTASLIDSLLAVDSTTEIKKRIQFEQQKNKRNLIVIVNAANVCYDHLDECVKAHDALAVETIDENALELPAPPTASMRIIDPLGKIYDRDASIALMDGNDPQFRVWLHEIGKQTQYLWERFGYSVPYNITGLNDVAHVGSDRIGLKIADFDQSPMSEDFPDAGKSQYYEYYKDRAMLHSRGAASVCLVVEGTLIREAKLYFQERELAKIALNTTDRINDGRYTDKAVTIVIETNRQNENWWDFNLDEEIVNFSKTQNAGDGVFYVIVRDSFGRERRFDLAYVVWRSVVSFTTDSSDKTVTYKSLYVTKRHRWWDPKLSGATLGESGKWSTDATARIYFNEE